MEEANRMNPKPPIGDLLTRLLDEVEGTSAAVDTEPAADVGAESTPASAAPIGTAGGSPLASLLGGMASNPALLAALPTLMENLSPLLSGVRPGGTGKTAPPGGGGRHALDRHTALLCAVKPYLSPERQTAADTVIRLCRVWDALEKSGLSLSGLFPGLGGGSVSAAGSALPAAEKEVP